MWQHAQLVGIETKQKSNVHMESEPCMSVFSLDSQDARDYCVCEQKEPPDQALHGKLSTAIFRFIEVGLRLAAA